jgi:hypothetical protein
MERLVEVSRLEVVAQPFEGGIVIEDRPDQRLLRLKTGGDGLDDIVI